VKPACGIMASKAEDSQVTKVMSGGHRRPGSES
jgi:hypothetical protein